ncbi:MAG: TonB C-terminal domain-containing protein [Deltaproteobacteria bacterium]|nr:TonB C-terminal domain-containing protein [Deltaproteobacteria bacterium]
MNFFISTNHRRKITFFLFTSVLFHLLLFFLLRSGLDKLASLKPPPTPPPIWVELKKMELPQRIADIPQPPKEETPEKPSAQALYSQKVPEETVNPAPPAASPARAVPQKKPATEKKPAEPVRPAESFKTKEELYAARQPDRMKDIFQTPPPSRHLPGLPDEVMDSAPSSTDDYFPDYKIGGRTYLNTLGNSNIRYFVELKRKFKLTFNPAPALRGRINEISRGKIDVVLGVSVDGNGELAELMVIRSSGIESYDKEGIRTVRASAPFSAPPANLLEQDGMIHMAWTFIVYL